MNRSSVGWENFLWEDRAGMTNPFDEPPEEWEGSHTYRQSVELASVVHFKSLVLRTPSGIDAGSQCIRSGASLLRKTASERLEEGT